MKISFEETIPSKKTFSNVEQIKFDFKANKISITVNKNNTTLSSINEMILDDFLEDLTIAEKRSLRKVFRTLIKLLRHIKDDIITDDLKI